MNDLVSIIMPCFNSGRFIEESIISVLNQTYLNWELIIIDDCSTDNGEKIIKKYVDLDNRIKLIRLKVNSGHPSVPRNYGIKEARGKFIAFLDSDDTWYPEKLMKQITFMHENNVTFSYSAYEWIAENGERLNRTILPSDSLNYSKLLKSCQIGCLTAIYDIEKLGKLFFRPDLDKEDYAYWLDIIKKSKVAYITPQILASYRIRKRSLSSNKWRMSVGVWNIYYKVEKLGLIKSVFYFTNFVFFWVKRRV